MYNIVLSALCKLKITNFGAIFLIIGCYEIFKRINNIFYINLQIWNIIKSVAQRHSSYDEHKQNESNEYLQECPNAPALNVHFREQVSVQSALCP